MAVPAWPRSATPTIPSCLAASELPSTLLLSEPPLAPRWDAASRSRSAWPGPLDLSDGLEPSRSVAWSILPRLKKSPRYKEGREFPARHETRSRLRRPHRSTQSDRLGPSHGPDQSCPVPLPLSFELHPSPNPLFLPPLPILPPTPPHNPPPP